MDKIFMPASSSQFFNFTGWSKILLFYEIGPCASYNHLDNTREGKYEGLSGYNYHQNKIYQLNKN